MKGASFTESAKRERAGTGPLPGGAGAQKADSTEERGQAQEGEGASRPEAAPAPEGCQYLFGDPKGTWRLCGEPVFRRSYCARHYRRCYARPGTAAHRKALLDIRRCLKLLRAWDGLPVRGEPPMPRP